MPRSRRVPITLDMVKQAEADAKALGRPVRLWDSVVPGLGCKVHPTGKRSWVLTYPRDDGGSVGAWREYTLRGAETLPLQTIRAEAKAKLALVLSGVDLLAAREGEREAPTVEDAFKEWLRHLATKGLKASTLDEYRRLILAEINYQPEDATRKRERFTTMVGLMAMKVKDVTTADVRRVFRAITERGSPKVANRILSRLHSFFAWCEEEEQGYRLLNSNPARLHRNKEEARERYLTDEETARLLAALDKAERDGLPVPPTLKAKKRPEGPRGRYKVSARETEPANPRSVSAIRLLLATGFRESEVLGLKYEHVNLKTGDVVLPMTKTGKSHRTLSKSAIAIIKAQPRMLGNPYVFPGKKKGEHLKEIKRVWYAVRHEAGLDGEDKQALRLHDLRHHFASTLASEGATLLQVGAALGHKSMAATMRYTHLFSNEIKALQDKASERIMNAGKPKAKPAAKKRKKA